MNYILIDTCLAQTGDLRLNKMVSKKATSSTKSCLDILQFEEPRKNKIIPLLYGMLTIRECIK